MSGFAGRRALATGAIVALLLASGPGRADVIAAGDGRWDITNTNGTDNGLPVGGTLTGTTPGLGAIDANLIATSQGDAFDAGLVLYLNNQVFVAPALSFTATSADSGVGLLAGLNTRVRYDALSVAGAATLRTLITLTNPSGSTINVSAAWVTNVGSDGSTQVIATSSGDTLYTTADRWIITDDASTIAGDPTNTFVLAGPGAVVTPSGASQTVFAAAGTEGVLSTFNLSIAAGATQSLLFFNQMSPTSSAAQAAVSVFNTLLDPGGPLAAGLSAGQLATVVNYGVVPEPSSLLLCGLGLTGVGAWTLRRRRRATA